MSADVHLRPVLAGVTLIAVTSVNVQATVEALQRSMHQVAFGAVKILTDRAPSALPQGIEWVRIPALRSAQAYSEFVLRRLADHVSTSHCLLIQWDSHVIDGNRWRPDFLSHDYVGARWPQFDDEHVVGNGGFSLRSRALLEACRDPVFRASHPEDLAIGRHNRGWLETRGLSFAPPSLADAFSTERAGDLAASFGYHGAWHMPRILGPESFWQAYCQLDERTSVDHDFYAILRELSQGKGGARRATNFIYDRIRSEWMRRRGQA